VESVESNWPIALISIQVILNKRRAMRRGLPELAEGFFATQ
jgi:hypothetical protein